MSLAGGGLGACGFHRPSFFSSVSSLWQCVPLAESLLQRVAGVERKQCVVAEERLSDYKERLYRTRSVSRARAADAV